MAARRTMCSRRQAGFTLVEILVATAVIGIGVAGLLVSLSAGTRVNDAGKRSMQAVLLAQELREWTITLPFRDPNVSSQTNPLDPDGNPIPFINDLDELTYSPPVNGAGAAMTMDDASLWSQHVSLVWLNPKNISQEVVANSSDLVRVDVGIRFNGTKVLSTSWILMRKL